MGTLKRWRNAHKVRRKPYASRTFWERLALQRARLMLRAYHNSFRSLRAAKPADPAPHAGKFKVRFGSQRLLWRP